MRYLASAFVGEGSFDRQFLPPLLLRALNVMCDEEFEESVHVPDVVILSRHAGPHTVAEILELVGENENWFNIVFVHRDQDRRARSHVMQQWFTPLRSGWGTREERLVPVIPVRTTDALTLADGDALRQVLGVDWSDQRLGIPARPAGVESLNNAKGIASGLFGSGHMAESTLARLGQLASIDTLRGVPAFAEWWVQTAAVLEEFGFKRR
jgi:hypothetical protein